MIDQGIDDLATASERQQGSGQTTATRTILSKGYYIDHLRIIDLHIYLSSRLAGEPPTTMDRLYDNNESKSKCRGAEQTKENNNEGPLAKDADSSRQNKTSQFDSYAILKILLTTSTWRLATRSGTGNQPRESTPKSKENHGNVVYSQMLTDPNTGDYKHLRGVIEKPIWKGKLQ